MEIQVIQNKIYEIRGQRVMLDFDLAAIYGVETKVLKQAVRRNFARFEGENFMFELSEEEYNSLTHNLRSQFVTSSSMPQVVSSSDHGGRRYMPFAFTETGVAMLSSVLRSETAIMLNRSIMLAFVAMRQVVSENSEIRARLELIERTNENILGIVNDLSEETREDIDNIYEALGELSVKVMDPPKRPRNPIGYNIPRG
jgi:signal transduction histidine kinase